MSGFWCRDRSVARSRSHIELVGTLPGLAGVSQCGVGRLVTGDGLVVYVVFETSLRSRRTPYNDPWGNDFPDNDIRFARLSLAAADMAGRARRIRAGHPISSTPTTGPPSLAPAYLKWRDIKKGSPRCPSSISHIRGVFGGR